MLIYPRTAVILAIVLLQASALAQQVKVRVVNMTIGMNKILETSQRMARLEVVGADNCRVKWEQNSTTVELIPFKNGKTKLFVYDAVEQKMVEEIRVNICSRDLITLYEQARQRYGDVEGILIDIENGKLVFSGAIFSMKAFQELQLVGEKGLYTVQGLTLHPYVNAVLSVAPSAIGPLPGQEPVEPSTPAAAPAAPAAAAPAGAGS